MCYMCENEGPMVRSARKFAERTQKPPFKKGDKVTSGFGGSIQTVVWMKRETYRNLCGTTYVAWSIKTKDKEGTSEGFYIPRMYKIAR